jgi:hypothetical protein
MSSDPGAPVPPVPPESTSSRGYRRSVFISWTLILLSVSFMLVAWNVVRPMMKRAHAGTGGENLDLRVAARLAVGSKVMLQRFGGSARPAKPATTRPAQPQLEALESAAKTPVDQLRAAIVAGDVEGAAESQARLEKIQVPEDQPALRDDLEALRAIYSGHADEVNETARQALIERHGWFGRLALAYGKPDSDPQRAELIEPATRAVITLYVVVLVVLGALVGGVVLFIVATILRATGRVRPLFEPVVPLVPRPVFLEAFAMFMFVFFIVLNLAIALLVKSPNMGHSMIGTLLLPLALAWSVWRGATWGETRLGFGWHLGPGLGGFRVVREMALGIVGYVTGLPLLAIAVLVSVRLSRWAGVSPTHPIIEELSRGGWRVVQIYVGACIWAPVMEEPCSAARCSTTFAHVGRS